MSSRSWRVAFLQKAIYPDSIYPISFWEEFPWVRVTAESCCFRHPFCGNGRA